MQSLRARKSGLLCRGHTRSQGRGSVLNENTTTLCSDHFPSLDTQVSTQYSPCLHTQPAITTFPTHLSYAHTHTCKPANPFVSYHLNCSHARMYMYRDIYLSVCNWGTAEEVQWWRPGVGQESGLPDRFAVMRWVQGQVSKARSGLGTGTCSIARASAWAPHSLQPKEQWRPQGRLLTALSHNRVRNPVNCAQIRVQNTEIQVKNSKSYFYKGRSGYLW